MLTMVMDDYMKSHVIYLFSEYENIGEMEDISSLLESI